MQRIFYSVVFSLLFGVFPVAAGAADASATADSALKELQDQKARLDAEKALVNSRKDLFEAQQNLLKAQFPEVQGGKTGALSIGTGSAYAIGAWAKVYERIDAAARTVCVSLGDLLTGKEPIITSDDEIRQTFRYTIGAQELALLLKEASAVTARPPTTIKPEGLPPIASIATVLTSVASLTKLFRTDRTIRDEAVSVEDSALKDAVARCLSERKIAFILPDVRMLPALLAGKSQFLTDLHSLVDKRTSLDAMASDTAAPDKAKAATALLTRIDTFVSDLLAAEGTTEAPLVSILRGEVLADAFKGTRPVLSLKLVKQGGISMTTSSIWREDRLYVGGGVIVSYRFSENDRLVRAEVIPKVDPNLTRINLGGTQTNEPAP